MLRVFHEPGRHLRVEQNGVERLRYEYQLPGDPSPSAPKPFCHPIRTPGGVEMTALSPGDHPWHRGLWFAWKYVNGVNYWEENQEIVGRQVTLAPPEIESVDTDAVRWTSEIAWRDDAEKGVERTRLLERRTITCQAVPDGALILDWDVTQTARQEVTLDRTPFTTWGGYGGLFVRMTQRLHAQRIVLAGGTVTQRPTGESYRWGAIEGALEDGSAAAFVFLPSPQNPRGPEEPFYGAARPDWNFFGPAPLFHEPLRLAAGETLRHRYRVLVLPRRVDADEADGYHREQTARESGTGRAS